jgi:hypothetical protein
MLHKCPNHSINDLLHGQAYALRNVYYRNFYLADAVAKKSYNVSFEQVFIFSQWAFLRSIRLLLNYQVSLFCR